MDTTQQIIERLKKQESIKEKPDIKELREIVSAANESLWLTQAISKKNDPQERKRFLTEIFEERKETLKESEKKVIQAAWIQTLIKLGEYNTANRLLREKLTRSLLQYKDYYDIDRLILTERKLGHIQLAEELAQVALQKNPEHVTPKNELIHLEILKGDKTKARALIEEQKSFYARKKELRTMEFMNYQQDEEETKRLEGMIEGDTELTQNLK